MKRLFLVVAVAVLSMASTYGEEVSTKRMKVPEAYQIKANQAQLARCLGLTTDQSEMVEDVFQQFRWDMQRAGRSAEMQRDDKVQKAVRRNLRYMRTILTPEQYRRYLMVLNTTLLNHGLVK